ncbi:Histone-Lysine N-Methyltransferase ash1l [Geranomyces michiganensis]|nr:Histone-Lysine N-Methyltransferase ash1l [Geranomyces michiganensis]
MDPAVQSHETPPSSSRRHSERRLLDPKVELEEEEDGEEEEEDEAEITRCVCARIESFGVMVQCETCFVWQHCECMNVHPKKLPKHYYCEECKPIGHSLYLHMAPQRTTSRTREMAAKDAAKQSNGKKRSTMNSREAAQSYADLTLLVEPGSTKRAAAAASAALGSKELYDSTSDEVSAPLPTTARRRGSQDDSAMGRAMRRFSGSNNGKSDVKSERKDSVSHTKPRDIEPITPEADHPKTSKRKRRTSASDPPDATAEPEPRSKRRADRLEHSELTVNTSSSSTKRGSLQHTDEAPPSSARSSQRREAAEEEPAPVQPTSNKRKRPDSAPRKASSTSNARTGKNTRAPRQSQSSAGTRGANKNGSHGAAAPLSATSTSHGSGVTAPVAEPPPDDHPVKVRIPNAKSSMGEMNKRVKQMSDYITRLQVAMAGEFSFKLPSPTPTPLASGSAIVKTEYVSPTSGDTTTTATTTAQFTFATTVSEMGTLIAGSGGNGVGGEGGGGVLTQSPSRSDESPRSPPQTPAKAAPPPPRPPPPRQQESFEMLDHLNLKLIKFQERFGSLSKR